MDSVCDSVLDAIGHTPMVALRRWGKGLNGTILVKLEYLNPGGSKKDRIGLSMVRTALREGKLRPGQTVVELTSGNTGTGLAIACAILGHPFVAVISEGNSIERARMMAAFGAEVVVVPQIGEPVAGQVSGADLEAVDRVARDIVHHRNAFRADQFTLPSNPAAHEIGTGEEIWRQSGGTITAFVDFAGTGGTFTGIARALKRHNPAIRCHLVEPASARFLAGQDVRNPRHKIQGGGYCRDLPLLDRSVCDGFLPITDEQALATTREIARTEGILGGFSTGANIAAARMLLEGPCPGATVACLACDSGMKYLSTDLYP